MKTPDFTPQALAAFVLLLLTNALVLFGIDLAPGKEAAIETLLNGVAVIGFLAHDLLLRRARAQNAVQLATANAIATGTADVAPLEIVSKPSA